MQRWTTPIEITLEGSGRQTIHGPYAAAMMLTIVWPVADGKWRQEAERLCLAAAEGKAPLEDARLAFLAAVREAAVTLHSEPGDEAIVLAEPPAAAMQRPADGGFAIGL